MYEYAARVIKVVDADTLHLDVDLGFDISRRDTFRLAGINAPEMSTPEGKRAREYVVTWCAEREGRMVARTVKDRREKFGRYLADLVAPDGSLVLALIAAGHAVPYDGGRR